MKAWLVAAVLVAVPCVQALALPGLPSLPTPAALADEPPGDKRIEFICPSPADGSAQFRTPEMNVVYTCPMRIYDNTIGGNSGWLFGNIDLAVHPTDPSQMAFFTLHGSPTDDGPNPYSRSGLTHSIFSSADHGIGWTDSWTTGSDYPGSEWLGEMATGAFDDLGNVYVAFLWSMSTGVAGEAADSLLGAYKMPPVDQASDYMGQYGENVMEFRPSFPGGFITRADMVHIPGPEAAPAPGNGTATPGQPTDNRTIGPGDVVLAWHQRAANNTNTPMSAWIEFAATHTGPGNSDKDWHRTAPTDLVGPCRDMSNVVAYAGKAYVVCAADLGYDDRRGADVGDLDLWAYDPATGRAEFVSTTGINGDNPQLAATPDGYFAVFASRLEDAQDVDVVGAMGWYGRTWDASAPGLGAILHQAMGGHPMRSAHVTGVAVLEESKTVFVTYKEWNEMPEVPAVDPNDPTAVPRLTDFHKFVFTTNACGELIAGAELVLGTSPDVYQQEGANQNQGAFDDRQDGLWVVRMPGGEERVQFAASDYGAAQFGQMRGATGAADDVCGLLTPPPPIPAPVIPQAVSLANPALAPVGILVGTASVAAVGYLMVLKRKAAVAASVKA
ncbi:MAG: hypothetical protein QOD77_1430 [Thermoplasmata archaeon]|jgi:hypothetical protein|nr:hypothetical protein [Thermoplasmata archaeon]